MKTQIEIDKTMTLWKQKQERRKAAARLLGMAAEYLAHGLSPDTLPVLVCGAKTKQGSGFCCRVCRLGEMRCYLHGGRSTGAKTAEGRARIEAGRKAYLENKKHGR